MAPAEAYIIAFMYCVGAIADITPEEFIAYKLFELALLKNKVLYPEGALAGIVETGILKEVNVDELSVFKKAHESIQSPNAVPLGVAPSTNNGLIVDLGCIAIINFPYIQ